jgi:hypothetical protein
VKGVSGCAGGAAKPGLRTVLAGPGYAREGNFAGVAGWGCLRSWPKAGQQARCNMALMSLVALANRQCAISAGADHQPAAPPGDVLGVRQRGVAVGATELAGRALLALVDLPAAGDQVVVRRDRLASTHTTMKTTAAISPMMTNVLTIAKTQPMAVTPSQVARSPPRVFKIIRPMPPEYPAPVLPGGRSVTGYAAGPLPDETDVAVVLRVPLDYADVSEYGRCIVILARAYS